MTAQPGKFSKLPMLPLRLIASHMDLKGVLTLSLISPYFNCAVGSLNYHIAEFKWIICAPGYFVIHLTQRGLSKIILRLSPQVLAKFVSSQVLLTGQKIEISRVNQMFSLKSGNLTSERIQLFEALTNFLLRICKPEMFSFDSNLLWKSVFEHTQKFEIFKLRQQNLSIESAKFLFEGIEVDSFKLENVNVETRDFQIFQLKHREMDLGIALWLSKESLKTMKCQNLKYNQRNLNFEYIKASDVLPLIRSWMHGTELRNLKSLEIVLPIFENTYREFEGMKNQVTQEVAELEGVEIGEIVLFFSQFIFRAR